MKLRSLSALAACSAALLPSTLNAQQTKPNIIFILADDMGYGDVAALDPNSKVKTPNLDQLVQSGITFTDAHTSSSVSTPSRYALLTGRYNWRSTMQSGVTWSFSAPLIERERPTVATILSQAGYNTGIIGKWHLGLGWERFGEGENDVLYTKVNFSPIDNGFDYSFIMSASLDIPPYTFIEGHNFTAPVNDTIAVQNGYGFYREGAIAEDFDINTALDRFASEATDFIGEQSAKDDPYFLYFPMTAPHTPILPPEEFQGKSGINPYCDFVMYVDDVVGRVLKSVRESGEEDNTIIVFSTDNGCSPSSRFDVTRAAGHNSNSIYRGMKADIFDGGHRVPFIVRWGDQVEAGSTCDKTISLASFMATCADIAEVEIPEGAAEDSFSIYDEITGKPKSDPRGGRFVIHHSHDGYFAIRQGDWKLIVCPFSGGWSYPLKNQVTEDMPMMQLFNMKDNPSEKTEHNLIDQYPKVAKRLYKELIWAVENGRTTPGKPLKNDVEVVIDKYSKPANK